jgi:hypothetical protein
MKKLIASLALVASAFTGVAAAPAHAQFAPIQQIGVDGFGNAICNGPQGVAPCAVIMAWMQRGGMNQQMPPSPFPQGGSFGPVGPMGVPTNIVPRDGQIVAQIGQACGGNPKCMGAAWATVEVQRCSQGVGVPGGCFGPNGEITKVINRVVPQHLQPNVILRNIDNDLRNGPGPNNEICKLTPFC